MKIGEKIRKIRDLRGFSQQALADEVGISQKQLSRYEKDDTSPTLELIDKICEALNIDVRELLDFEETKIFNNYHQQGGEYVAVKYGAHEEIRALYEKLIQEKETTIVSLKEQIGLMNSILRKEIL